MSYNKKISDTSVRLGPVRFSYVNVFAPRKSENSAEDKYQVTVIIPKTDTNAKKLIDSAIEAAKKAGKAGKWDGKLPANLKLPLRDGDADHPDDEAFANSYFLNCSSKQKPGVRVLENGLLSEALDSEDFYSGCYGAITVNFFAYAAAGNKGVGVGLNNCIKTEDGERLGGGSTAEEDFADMGDDPLN